MDFEQAEFWRSKCIEKDNIISELELKIMELENVILSIRGDIELHDAQFWNGTSGCAFDFSQP